MGRVAARRTPANVQPTRVYKALLYVLDAVEFPPASQSRSLEHAHPDDAPSIYIGWRSMQAVHMAWRSSSLMPAMISLI